MRNTPKSLNEELNRMKRLMTFNVSENSHDVLSENFVKKSTIYEQTELETVDVSVVENCFGYADDTSVFNVVSYTPLMKWWCDNDKEKGVEYSKNEWKGSGKKSDDIKVYHNRVISKLDDMVNNEKLKENKIFSKFIVPLTKLKEKLEKLASENIYIPRTGFNQVSSINGKFSWLYDKKSFLKKDGEIDFGALGGEQAKDFKKVKSVIDKWIGSDGGLIDTKFMKQVSSIAYGSEKGENILVGDVTMSVQDKINILNKLTARVKSHFGDDNYDVSKGIKKAISIKLSPKKEQQVTKTDIIPDTEPQTMTQNLTYPNIDGGERLPENTTMFGDDEFKLKPSAKDNLESLLKEGIDSITSQNGKITKISYGSAASTSKVNTKFGGVGEDGNALPDKDKSSPDNNIPLVKARILDINTTIRNLINNNDTLSNVEGLEIVQGENLEMPNEGPSWLTNNGTYGQLYNDAYNVDKTLTPRKFYTQDNKAIRDEYNSVFQKYRMSYGYIKFEFRVEDSSEEPSVEYAVVGDWRITIKWREWPSIRPPRLPRLKGGSAIYKGGISVDCPKPKNGWWSNYMVNGK